MACLLDLGEYNDKVGLSFKAFTEMLKFLPELKRLGKESRAAVLWTPVLCFGFTVKALEIPTW